MRVVLAVAHSPFHVLRGSLMLYRSLPAAGVTAYSMTPHRGPDHGLSHTHALEAEHTPFRLQSLSEEQDAPWVSAAARQVWSARRPRSSNSGTGSGKGEWWCIVAEKAQPSGSRPRWCFLVDTSTSSYVEPSHLGIQTQKTESRWIFLFFAYAEYAWLLTEIAKCNTS